MFPTASQPAGTSVPLILPSDLQQSNPSFFSINTIRQFSVAAPSNSHSSSPKKWRKTEGEEKKKAGDVMENIFRKLQRGQLVFGRRCLGAAALSSPHIT